MANIREIQSRINSVKDTMKITNAMYMISSSKMTQARKKLADTEPYFYGLQGEISRILRHVPEIRHSYFDARQDIPAEQKRIGSIVITADKGLAGAYNHNIIKLEEEIRAREDFVGAFAHELKTPLTSIIGYADALRSRRLDEEKQFMSANYIYTEGKRLEAMSFRLLDIMVTRRGEVEFTMVSAESLFLYLYDMYVINKSMKIYFNYDDGMVRAEANLIKSVLMNLLDNAFKASEADGLIEVYGHLMKDGYCFEVKDHGVGIPKEELHKITKAFYMVDKSRSRSRNGAGLGLALCAEILELHKSRLNIRSELGKGTTMSFTLPLWKEDQL